MLIFAYGSNMCTGRLRARVPSTRVVGAGTLPGHVLRFHKRGADGSAKANAARTDDPRAALPGVVFEIDPAHERELDRHEGGYHAAPVTVHLAGGVAQASCYFAEAAAIVDGLVPFTWYRRYVLAGALEHRLAAAHVAAILAVDAIDDPDPERHARNWIELPGR